MFESFGLKPTLLESLRKANFIEPTAIQTQVIPAGIEGKNIVGQSQTGTGKTAAFLVPILNNIDTHRHTTLALILGPTRELVSQIREDVVNLSRAMTVRSTAIYGGASVFGQKKDLDRKPHIVAGTPGRTIDFIERRALDLNGIEYLVLDEVDRMLDMGFVDDIEFIWANCKNLKQVFAFSATITPEIRSIIEGHLGVDYTYVKSGDTITVEKIDHSFMEVPHFEKYEMLKSYLETHRKADEKVLVFTETKRNTEQLVEKLEDDGFEAGYINGDMRQSQRFRMMDRYKKGFLKILVTTDVAARGLNLGHIHMVINYDVPNDPESYIHRIGRTGRAGKEGKAIMFVSRAEGEALRKVEKSNKIRIKKVDSEGVEISRDNEREERGGSSSNSSGRGRGGRSFGGRSGGFSWGRSSSRGGFGDRKPREDFGERKSFGERKPFGERKTSSEGGEKREWAPRKPREDFGDRKPKAFGERKSFSTSSSRTRFGISKGGDAESRIAGSAWRGFWGKKSFWEGSSRGFEKPRAPRGNGEFFSNIDSESVGQKSFGGSSSYSDRPARKSFWDRKPYEGKKSFGERKPFGERKTSSEGGEKRDWSARKPREDFGDRKPFGDKKYPVRKPFKKKED